MFFLRIACDSGHVFWYQAQNLEEAITLVGDHGESSDKLLITSTQIYMLSDEDENPEATLYCVQLLSGDEPIDYFVRSYGKNVTGIDTGTKAEMEEVAKQYVTEIKGRAYGTLLKVLVPIGKEIK